MEANVSFFDYEINCYGQNQSSMHIPAAIVEAKFCVFYQHKFSWEKDDQVFLLFRKAHVKPEDSMHFPVQYR